MQWDATLYDQQHDFVSKYGKSLIEVLQPKAGEKILDLGCGTGDLAQELLLRGCDVTGIDASQEMIEKAKVKYPDIKFYCADACSYYMNEEFDAVFSNAALHWIKDQDAVLENIFRHLKKDGRFIAEMGVKGNVKMIRNTIHTILLEHGYTEQAAIRKWYFPSVAEYASLLEKHGFDIRLIESYDRPTVLTNTENGIVEWLEMFAATFFKDIAYKEKQELLYEIQDRLYNDLYHDGMWIADYKRLRFLVVKKCE